MKACPHCNQTNPDTAMKCDCGYRWNYKGEGGGMTLPAPDGVRVVAIDMPWLDLFAFCLKAAICAIPAIWIAVFAYKLPGLLLDGATAISANQQIHEAAQRAKEDRDRALRDNPLR